MLKYEFLLFTYQIGYKNMWQNKFMLGMSFLLILGNSLCLDVSASEGFSGQFSSVMIGVDNDGKLTGYYENHTGWDNRYNAPKYSCLFYISGTRRGDRYQISTWYPGDSEYIEGSLKFIGDRNNPMIRLKLDGEHGGCWNVAPLLKEGEGVEYNLTKRGNWNSIRVVSADKAFFYSSPNSRNKRKAYVIKNDVLRVLKTRAGWVKAEFGNGRRITRGWIKSSDLFADEPVRTR